MNYGRYEIFTSEYEVNSSNIIKVLQDSISKHMANSAKCDELLSYEAGIQPLKREKTYRKDINIIDVDNVAAEISQFKCGFMWGYPITLVQRGTSDNGNAQENQAIRMLNECFDAQNLKGKTQQLARFVEITGVGYTLLDFNREYEKGESYFTYDVLDPRNTFVVKSNIYPDHRIMLGVTYSVDDYGNKHYTCFTKKQRFEVYCDKVTNGEDKTDNWYTGQRSGEANPIGKIPIVEWIRSFDRMGCFERQIDDMNALNILESDYANGVDQNIQCIWHGNDIAFPQDSEGNIIKPSSNDWIMTQTVEGGTKPSITPLSVTYDFTGMLSNITTKRALILQKCNVPQRNDNSGGSTGIAMSDATGWSNAEVEANALQGLQEASKIQEVKIALEIIKLSNNVKNDNPLLNLTFADVKPNIKRQKTYEMTTKANAFATFVKHGLDYKSVLQAINFFDDPQQVANDSEETMRLFIESNFKSTSTSEKPDAGKLMQDESDQVDNSPMLG